VQSLRTGCPRRVRAYNRESSRKKEKMTIEEGT
jgi:hypothetical protein